MNPETPVAASQAVQDAVPPLVKQGSLYQQVKLARVWLPLGVIGVVLVYQLLVVPRGGESFQFWAQLLFYSLLGPLVTYITLNWIASEVRERERAQNELRRLYDQLQASHARLSTLQRVTERFAAATDLEGVLSAAGQGIAEVTGAEGTALILSAGGTTITRTHQLSCAMIDDAKARNQALSQGKLEPSSAQHRFAHYYVLAMPLVWGGKLEGSIHAYFPSAPSAEQGESFSILSSEFSASAEATRSRTRDLLTLFEVDRSIRAEGNLERLLETLLAHTMTRTDALFGGVYLADEEGLLQLSAWQGLASGEKIHAVRVASGLGIIGEAAVQQQPQLTQQLSPEARAAGGPVLEHASSALSLPLHSDQGLLGVVVLGHRTAQHFNDANLPLLNLIAGQVSLAVRNARAYLQAEELAIAEERARIAREIHDGVAQSLAFSALKLDLVERLLSEPDKAQKELKQAKDTIRETIKEVRRSIFALRPVDLERHGFVETIRRYSNDYSQQNDIRVSVTTESAPRLSVKSEAVLFRIFQEAMHNVAKHARASEVSIALGNSADGHGYIEICDNGQGFNVGDVSDRVTSAGGLGLKQMRERIEGRRGRFEIDSCPGRGTRLLASVPE